MCREYKSVIWLGTTTIALSYVAHIRYVHTDNVPLQISIINFTIWTVGSFSQFSNKYQRLISNHSLQRGIVNHWTAQNMNWNGGIHEMME